MSNVEIPTRYIYYLIFLSVENILFGLMFLVTSILLISFYSLRFGCLSCISIIVFVIYIVNVVIFQVNYLSPNVSTSELVEITPLSFPTCGVAILTLSVIYATLVRKKKDDHTVSRRSYYLNYVVYPSCLYSGILLVSLFLYILDLMLRKEFVGSENISEVSEVYSTWLMVKGYFEVIIFVICLVIISIFLGIQIHQHVGRSDDSKKRHTEKKSNQKRGGGGKRNTETREKDGSSNNFLDPTDDLGGIQWGNDSDQFNDELSSTSTSSHFLSLFGSSINCCAFPFQISFFVAVLCQFVGMIIFVVRLYLIVINKIDPSTAQIQILDWSKTSLHISTDLFYLIPVLVLFLSLVNKKCDCGDLISNMFLEDDEGTDDDDNDEYYSFMNDENSSVRNQYQSEKTENDESFALPERDSQVSVGDIEEYMKFGV